MEACWLTTSQTREKPNEGIVSAGKEFLCAVFLCDSSDCPSECMNSYTGLPSFDFWITKRIGLHPHSLALNPKLPELHPFPVHLVRLTCGRFIQKSTQVKHFKHGIHRFMWIFDRFTRAANFLENSHFLFAAVSLWPHYMLNAPQ